MEKLSNKEFHNGIEAVQKEFNALLTEISDTDSRITYKKFIKGILETVVYRHTWYMQNMEMVLNEVFPLPKTTEKPKVSIEAFSNNSQARKINNDKPQPFIEDLDRDQGGGFTASRRSFYSMLARMANECKSTKEFE